MTVCKYLITILLLSSSVSVWADDANQLTQPNAFGVSAAPPKETNSISDFFQSYSTALKTCQIYQDTILGGMYSVSILGKKGEQCEVEVLTPGITTTCLFDQSQIDATLARLAKGSEQLKGADQIMLANKTDLFPEQNCQSQEGEITFDQKQALKNLMEQIGNQPLEAKQWKAQ